MTNLRNLLVLASLFLFSACGSEAGAAGTLGTTAQSISECLAGIKDGKSAEAAKDKLSGLTDKLGTALSSLKSSGEGAAADAKSKLGDMAKNAMGSLPAGITKSFGGITEKITGLMANAEIKNAIGPILEKLKGLVSQ